MMTSPSCLAMLWSGLISGCGMWEQSRQDKPCLAASLATSVLVIFMPRPHKQRKGFSKRNEVLKRRCGFEEVWNISSRANKRDVLLETGDPLRFSRFWHEGLQDIRPYINATDPGELARLDMQTHLEVMYMPADI